LTGEFFAACDPNISFDGRRMLFAGRKEPQSRWRIWEIGLDGQGLRPVSPESLEARSPIYVSTLFTLDSPEPWFTAVFVGREAAEQGTTTSAASALYNVKLDGGELRRLTYQPGRHFDPFQMWDGRVIYAAERFALQPGGSLLRVALHAIHVEGADMELFGGERGGAIQRMPCATESGVIVFVEPEPGRADGAGQLACVEERRPHVTFRRVTEDRSAVYRHPSPWRGSQVIVARRAARGRGTWAVDSLDVAQSRRELVFDTAEYDEVQAVVARPRTQPDGHSTVVESSGKTGIFYGLNCYDADQRMAPYLQTGMVKRVRFIEGVMPATVPSTTRRSGGQWLARRLVGEAPVEADGSFNVEVPADIPLLVQTLDERGLALATCGWVWVKPKEKRGCIGCHEDPERIPENDFVLALRRPSHSLVLPAADRRAVAFREEIVPILKSRCAAADCHGASKTPLRLPLLAERPAEADLQQAYAALMAPAAKPRRHQPGSLPSGKYVDPGCARTSRLVWSLTGTNLSRPWDNSPATRGGKRVAIETMPPAGKGEALSEEELRTVIQWIDMGAQYQAPPPENSSPGKLAGAQ
jgi:hypothetical protein